MELFSLGLDYLSLLAWFNEVSGVVVMDKPKVLITGAGPEAGELAVEMVNRGYAVEVSDPIVIRSTDIEDLRNTQLVESDGPCIQNSGPKKKRGKGNKWNRGW